jgi:hypothetical protein
MQASATTVVSTPLVAPQARVWQCSPLRRLPPLLAHAFPTETTMGSAAAGGRGKISGAVGDLASLRIMAGADRTHLLKLDLKLPLDPTVQWERGTAKTAMDALARAMSDINNMDWNDGKELTTLFNKAKPAQYVFIFSSVSLAGAVADSAGASVPVVSALLTTSASASASASASTSASVSMAPFSTISKQHETQHDVLKSALRKLTSGKGVRLHWVDVSASSPVSVFASPFPLPSVTVPIVPAPLSAGPAAVLAVERESTGTRAWVIEPLGLALKQYGYRRCVSVMAERGRDAAVAFACFFCFFAFLCVVCKVFTAGVFSPRVPFSCWWFSCGWHACFFAFACL